MNEVLGELFKIKGRVLSKCSYYEQRMDLFIAKHFMGEENYGSLIEEMLENEIFSFELKRRIFCQLLENHYPDYFKIFPSGPFIRFQKIRNIFAHGMINLNSDDAEAKLAFLRHGAENHPIVPLLEEFDRINTNLAEAFEALPLSSVEEKKELTGIE